MSKIDNSNSQKISHVLFFLLLATLVAGQFARIKLSSNIALNISDIIIWIWLLKSVIADNPFSYPQIKTYTKWVCVVFAIFILSLVIRIPSVPFKEILIATLYPVRWLMYFALPVALIPYAQKVDIKKHLITAITIIASLGFLQLLIFPNLKFLESIGYDPHYFRLVSTWLDPNFLGMALVAGIALQYTRKTSIKIKLITLAILVSALLFTFSRSAYLTFALTGTILAITTRSFKTFLYTLAISLVFIASFIIPRQQIDKAQNIDREFSANYRLVSYVTAFEIARDYPVFGAGYDLIRYEKRERYKFLDVQDGGNSGAGIDSSFLLVLASTGAVGLLIYISFWYRVLHLILIPESLKNYKQFNTIFTQLKYASLETNTILAITIGWLAHSWFVNSLFFPGLICIWVIIFSVNIKKERAA